jgi:hypothetical protein
MSFTITALDPSTTRSIRTDITTSRLDARRVVLDEAGAPCRACLEPGQVGEAMLLFVHQPFTGRSPYAMPSPIYVHERDCVPYDPATGVPSLLAAGPRAVRSYDAHHDLLDGEVGPGRDVADMIERAFADERAAYLHVYSASAGCYTCRVDRG